MTDNRDWAAEIVMEILNQHGTDDHIHLDKLCEVLRKVDRAAELRGRVKGEFEGVRLCHDMVGDMVEFGNLDAVELREKLRELRIEKFSKLSPTT